MTRTASLLARLPLVTCAHSPAHIDADAAQGLSRMQFGARCDGTADDAGPITAAIDAARKKGVAVLLQAARCRLPGADGSGR